MRARASLEIKGQREIRTSVIIKLQAKNGNQAKIGDAIEENTITSKTKEQHLHLCHPPIARAHMWCQCPFNSVGGILCLQTFMKLLFHPNFEILSFCLFSQGFAHCLFKKLTNLSKCINERWDAPYQFLPLLATFIQSKNIFGRFLTLRLQLCKFLSCLWSLS